MCLPGLMRVCHTKKLNKPQNVYANHNSSKGFLLLYYYFFYPQMFLTFSPVYYIVPLPTVSYALFILNLVFFDPMSFTATLHLSVSFH